MDVIKYEMEVPKESKEIVDFIEKIVDHFIAKKDLAELTGILPEGIAAFDGFDQVDDELKSQYRDELAGYLVHKVLGKLIPVKSA